MLAGNMIFVGRKPAKRYVAVILEGFNERGLDEIVLKARGAAISAVVDAAKIARRIVPGLGVEVGIMTRQVIGDDGGIRSVTAMDITLRRSRGAVNRAVVSQPRRQDKAA